MLGKTETGGATGGEHMHGHNEVKSGGKEDKSSRQFAENIAKQPGEYLEPYMDHEGKSVISAAGGGLVTQFGNEQSQIWKKMQEAGAANTENPGVITVAGINFKVDALGRMGEFYQWLESKKDYSFRCIDERLAGQGESKVHCGCGACAALHAGLTSVSPVNDGEGMENLLTKELYDQNGAKLPEKQALLQGMEHAHASRTIFVDTTATPKGLTAEAKTTAQAQSGLPFIVSLPIDLIKEYAKNRELDNNELSELLDVLVQWNVQIAQNIISGDHNDLKPLATDSILVLDTNGSDTEGVELNSTLKANLGKVIPEPRWMSVRQS